MPRARVGFEVIDTRLIANNHLISNKGAWGNCFIENNQEILLDLADRLISLCNNNQKTI